MIGAKGIPTTLKNAVPAGFAQKQPRGNQTIPQGQVTSENLVEKVQLLYDLLSGAQNGKINRDLVNIFGVTVGSTDWVLEQIRANFTSGIVQDQDDEEEET